MPVCCETIEIETAPDPDAAVIWMHGLGADCHDFEPVVPQIVRRGERAWRFVFPTCAGSAGHHQRRHEHARLVRHPGIRPRCAAEDAEGFRATDQEVRG